MSDVILPDAVQTIPAALAFWAERTPNAPAVIVPGLPAVTFAEIWRRANDLGATLTGCGIGRRDRVVLLAPEGAVLVATFLGTTCAAIAVPLSATLSAAELGRALDGLGAAAAIVTPAMSAGARALLAQRRVSVFDLHGGDAIASLSLACPTKPARVREEEPRAGDIALVNETSGTTGKPKRVPRTHGHLMSSGRSHRDAYRLTRHDRGALASPMSLSLGTSTVLQGIVAGAALIVSPLPDLPRFWDALIAERATWMQASAGFLELLARFLLAKPALPRPPSLRFVRVTAAAMSPQTGDELEHLLGVPVLPSYSSSEAGRISMALPPPALRKPGSAGQVVQEARIVDAAGAPVGPGDEGEIWVRGPAVFAGYLDDPEMNVTALLPGGWFRTGDVGSLDEDGFLFITGRVNELINRGGAKIAPAEIDEVLRAHPAVGDAAAFAAPDERLGEDIVAAVVLAPGSTATPRELRAWMLDRLAPHKAPRRIWFVDDLPRNGYGKVLRGELAQRWNERYE